MTYNAKIQVKSGQLEAYESMFGYDGDDMSRFGIPKLDNIKTWTAEFPNGCVMDVKVNSSEDDVWSEAVLLDEGYSELCHTDVSDSLSGEWTLEYNGDVYKVEVVAID